MTLAVSVSRTRDGGLQVDREEPAELVLSRSGDQIEGTLSGTLEGLGSFTARLRGTFEQGTLDLETTDVEVASGELPPDFRGFYLDGTLEEGLLSGEMWSAVIRDGQERHRGPLPWRAVRHG